MHASYSLLQWGLRCSGGGFFRVSDVTLEVRGGGRGVVGAMVAVLSWCLKDFSESKTDWRCQSVLLLGHMQVLSRVGLSPLPTKVVNEAQVKVPYTLLSMSFLHLTPSWWTLQYLLLADSRRTSQHAIPSVTFTESRRPTEERCRYWNHIECIGSQTLSQDVFNSIKVQTPDVKAQCIGSFEMSS